MEDHWLVEDICPGASVQISEGVAGRSRCAVCCEIDRRRDRRRVGRRWARASSATSRSTRTSCRSNWTPRAGGWVQSSLEIVTPDTRAKVRELLADAATLKSSNWRQVNHPSPGGEDIPVLYSAINIGRKDRFVVVGRDLRPLAAMQQRLINAQQSMERDYVRLRHAETRYRLLFQVSSEAVMIVDSSNSLILDANPAALALFDESAPQLLKSGFPSHFDADGAQAGPDAAGGCSRHRPRRQRARASCERAARMPGRGVAVSAGERVAVPGSAVVARYPRRKTAR